MSGFFDFMRNNFLHVAPILIAAGFAVAIIVERSRALFKIYPIENTRDFFEKLTDLVISGKVAEAISHCDRYSEKPVAQVIKQGLLRAHQPETLIEHGLQIAVGEAAQTIQRRTSFLATIANVATLLGLFGTIAGLVSSFEAVGHADPQQKATLLAAGISTAMNATMMGLAVAIPCMVAYSFLMNKSNRLISEVDSSAIRTMDILKQRYYSAESNSLFGEDEDAVPVSNGHGKVAQMRKSV
jgi:biopolymer transport protein ExbB